jgi:hypothetical protein
LAADPAAVGTVYAVSDSYYGTSRIHTIDASTTPARIMAYVDLKQDGQPVAYDLEGIVFKGGGGFRVVSEGLRPGGRELGLRPLSARQVGR